MTLDLRSLALFRASLAVASVVDVLDRLRSPSLLGPDAPLADSWRTGLVGFTFFSVGPAWLWFALHVAVAVAVFVGFRTRIALALLLVSTISLQQSTLASVYGGDTLLRALLVWSLFLPTGARLSVDARFDASPGFHRSLASIALGAQFVLLLSLAAIEKLATSAAWREGRVLDELLHNPMYATPLGLALADAPALLLRLLSFATLAIELVAPLLLFARSTRVRVAGILLIALMLTGFGVFLGVGLFPVVVVAGLGAFIPSTLWRIQDSAAPTTTLPRAANIAAAVCVLIAATTSVLNAARIDLFARTPAVLRVSGLFQHWGMFVSPESLPRGVVRALGVDQRGDVVDVLGTTATDTFFEAAPFRERRIFDTDRLGPDDDEHHAIVRWLCAKNASVVHVRVQLALTSGAVVSMFEGDCARPPDQSASRLSSTPNVVPSTTTY